MQDLEIWMFIAVFQEMLGWAIWPIAALCVAATLALGLVLLRDRRLVAPRLLRAELLGVLGGLAAVAAMFAITSSWPGDMGGPIDWLLAIGIFVAGGLGTAITAYAVVGLFAGRPGATAP
jgi:hypothetical protein